MPTPEKSARPTPGAKFEAFCGRAPARGCWVHLPTVISAEIVAQAGFDIGLIDLEHGPAGYETVMAQLIALKAGGAAAMVRVPELRGPWIKRALDAGAGAVLVPLIENTEDAVHAVRAFRFGPEGDRGNATGLVRAARYGADADYLRRWNDDGVLMLQIESPHALDAAEEIAAVDGVDALFFGPNDYAAAAAFPAQSVVDAALDRVVTAARAHGKLVGTVLFGGSSADQLEARGVDLVVVASDQVLLRKAAREAATR